MRYTTGTETLSHRQLQTKLNVSFPKDRPPAGWSVYTPPPPPELTEAEKLDRWRQSAQVSRFQARAALHAAGLLDQVEAIMAAPETDPLAVLAWQDAQYFRRASPTIATLSAALGLTDEQADQLFRDAAQIEA